jgi:predicted TIM-barrel fold metal-dependent hydrolase
VIVDCHTHLASDRYTPRSFLEGAALNLGRAMESTGIRVSLARMMDQVLAGMQDHDGVELLASMDDAGIARSIVLAPDFTVALRDSRVTVEELVLGHRAVLERHRNRLDAFVGVDPRHGTDGLALLERALGEWGFAGFKVYPPCGFSPSDERLLPFYEICRAHRAPVLVHMGPTSPALPFDTARPELLERAALSFPDVNFILAHASVAHTEDAILACAFRPNVYLDLSGFQGDLAGGRAQSAIRSILARGIAHKVLFGTDWPVFRRHGSQRDGVELIVADGGPLSNLPPRHVDMILHQNVERLLSATTARRRYH